MVNIKQQVVIGYTQKLFCDGLESLIDGTEDFSVRECVSVEKLNEYLVTKNSFDILILELNYPNNENLSFIADLKKKHPMIHIMLLSQMPGINLSSKLIDSGIESYLLKTCNKHDIFTALRKVVDGNNFYCSEIIKPILSKSDNHNHLSEVTLTDREAEILSLLVNCKTNIQIANELGISENTVKTHRKNIQEKFGVNNMIGMIRYACRARLIDYGPDGFCVGCPHFN